MYVEIPLGTRSLRSLIFNKLNKFSHIIIIIIIINIIIII